MSVHEVSARNVVPRRWHARSRRIYTRIGRLTASSRLLPTFMMIGASRSGTTSLFRAVSAHPCVLRPTVNKGVNYFDLNYFQGFDWYRGHFPLARTLVSAAPRIAFEASGYYLFHPFALERIARDLPDMKFLVMLRDPVERAYSAYKHELARGFEWESIDRAFALEDERLVGEVDRMRRDPTYESFSHRHNAYLRRGEYAEQLERAFQLFPREQFHILESESFFEQPATEYRRMLGFLGLSTFDQAPFDQRNSRPSSPMAPELRAQLREHYASHNRRLAQLLDRPPRWAREQSGETRPAPARQSPG